MQGELLLLLVVHLTATALPGAAAALLAARNGVRSVPVLLAVGLAATGVLAMLAFWAYYLDQVIGQSFSFFVLFGSVLLFVWCLWEGEGVERDLLRRLATPLGLWALGSAFLVFFGFLYGTTDYPVETASIRFSGQLPSDNDLPRFFSEWFYVHGSAGDPVYGEWLASDRPPLQIGYVLSQRPFAFLGSALHYQVLSVVLQQLWIVGLWALLSAARLDRLTRGLIMLTVLLSPLAILNGFFVWPKLLPAAMLLAAAALVLTPLWDEVRGRLAAAVLAGVLVALAMMGHGSSVFGIIPLALVAAWRGLPGWRWIAVAALAAIVVAAPWSAYQKYDQPPGDRLLKWSLAGVPEIDDRGTTETIVDSYREVGFDGAIHNKGQNFVTMLGGGPAWEALDRAADGLGSGDFEAAVQEVRIVLFFCFFPSLGLLLIAPFAMLAARRRSRDGPREWSFALLCFAVVGVGCLAWGLLSFGDLSSRTVLHVSSYALPILAFAGCVAGLRSVFPRFALWYVLVAAAAMLAIYVPNLEMPSWASFSVWSALLALAALGGFAALALGPARGPRRSAAPRG